ncbi:hypothetical protein Rleg5DRAFT_2537 [Rhizobium leguminosarum bv. viciae WSM1455]|nr:hypothetical protein Rleg5DRAFT_2537 [Rhizobium leguminosarum bv. viciae WSM1455]
MLPAFGIYCNIFIALCGFSEDLNPTLHKVSHDHLSNFE